MINLCENHSESLLWICSYLDNKELFQMGLSNSNFYALLKPLFDSIQEHYQCQKLMLEKEEEINSMNKFRLLDEWSQRERRNKEFENIKLNYKVAIYWKDHNELQIKSKYNPNLISDYQKARNRAHEEIEVQKICQQLGAVTKEAAMRNAAFAKDHQISFSNFKLLCKHVTNINEQSSNGNTALHWAIKANNENFVFILLHRGANCKIRNSRGETPLHFAALLDTDNIVGALLKNKAYMNAQDNQGKTPLDWAISRKTACINFLKSKKAESSQTK